VLFSCISVTDHYPDLPRTIGQLYTEVLDEIVLAENLGFKNYFIAEHHFHEYGVVPSPASFLAAAAVRTSTIGLGPGIAVLPFHDPLIVAEEYAMIDQLSSGRLAMGIGSGYLQHEFDGFNVGPWEKRARFDEAAEILDLAWKGDAFSYHGYYYHVTNVRLTVTPVQTPPPMWTAVLRAEAAYYVGLQGRNIMLVPYGTANSIEDLRAVVDGYLQGRREGGFAGRPDIAASIHSYVGSNDDKARREAEPALDRYIDTRLYARNDRRYDELDKAGLLLIGSPAKVIDGVGALAELGINHLMLMPNFGAIDTKLAAESLQRFSGEVAPSFA
jgi:alkanesulfonate monooxygenase SsuD/methylene tetrahydromethanopterin reductase-like flavin-dependent oxidoreductase (luciferase family)